MASACNPSRTQASQQSRWTRRRSRGLPVMSAKQTEAYLMARDLLRRIQRAAVEVRPSQRPG